MSLTETMVTNTETGGAKGQKCIQLGAYDPLALLELGRVSAMGASKYAAFNYLKGYDWRLSMDALQRHLLLFWAGEDHDQESGALHTAHAMWHAGALTSFQLRDVGVDNRPPSNGLGLAEALRAQRWADPSWTSTNPVRSND